MLVAAVDRASSLRRVEEPGRGGCGAGGRALELGGLDSEWGFFGW